MTLSARSPQYSEKGLRTGDIASGENDQQILGTEAMGDAVMAALQ